MITSVSASPPNLSDTEATQLEVSAADPDGSPTSISYIWSVSPVGGSFDDPTSPTPVFTPPDVTNTTDFTLTVTVSDGDVSVADQVTITVSDADGTGNSTLLEEYFTNGMPPGWTVVDEGAADGPSAWTASSGVLLQSSNIYGGSTNGNLLPKPGTYLRYDAGAAWSDYRASFTLRSHDDDALGAVFRMADSNNYYRFSWDKQRSYRRLVKRVNGTFTLLAEDSVPFVQGQTYQVAVEATGDLIAVRINGTVVFSVNDAAHATGTVAFYSWGNTGAEFDGLSVLNP